MQGWVKKAIQTNARGMRTGSVGSFEGCGTSTPLPLLTNSTPCTSRITFTDRKLSLVVGTPTPTSLDGHSSAGPRQRRTHLRPGVDFDVKLGLQPVDVSMHVVHGDEWVGVKWNGRERERGRSEKDRAKDERAISKIANRVRAAWPTTGGGAPESHLPG